MNAHVVPGPPPTLENGASRHEADFTVLVVQRDSGELVLLFDGSQPLLLLSTVAETHRSRLNNFLGKEPNPFVLFKHAVARRNEEKRTDPETFGWELFVPAIAEMVCGIDNSYTTYLLTEAEKRFTSKA